jgi:hypothetical protein
LLADLSDRGNYIEVGIHHDSGRGRGRVVLQNHAAFRNAGCVQPVAGDQITYEVYFGSSGGPVISGDEDAGVTTLYGVVGDKGYSLVHNNPKIAVTR